MKKLCKYIIAFAGLTTGQAVLAASGDSMMLESGDFVGYSFWLISMALAAATVFFLMESLRMGGKWATSRSVPLLLHARGMGFNGQHTN